MGPQLIAAVVLGAGQAAIGKEMAKKQNRAIQASINATVKNAADQQRAVARQTGIEQLKRVRESQAIRGAIRVAAGEAGLGEGGTYMALMRQTDQDQAINRDVLMGNYANSMAAVQSGASANLSNLQSQYTNPLVAAFMGGAQGIGTGLQIGDSINRMRTP